MSIFNKIFLYLFSHIDNFRHKAWTHIVAAICAHSFCLFFPLIFLLYCIFLSPPQDNQPIAIILVFSLVLTLILTAVINTLLFLIYIFIKIFIKINFKIIVNSAQWAFGLFIAVMAYLLLLIFTIPFFD